MLFPVNHHMMELLEGLGIGFGKGGMQLTETSNTNGDMRNVGRTIRALEKMDPKALKGAKISGNKHQVGALWDSPRFQALLAQSELATGPSATGPGAGVFASLDNEKAWRRRREAELEQQRLRQRERENSALLNYQGSEDFTPIG